MEEIVKIPAERIKILLGKDRKTKETIEKKCKIKLNIGAEGEVHISGESADVFLYKDVVVAIGRGFNPKKAMKLANPEYQFYLFHLKEHVTSEKAITRVKGRIIGHEGKMREEIEQATESYLSVFGNTVGIIAKMDSMKYAKEAVEMLINGAKHSTVYAVLAKAKRRILEDRLKGI